MVQTSKLISFILRHKPEAFNIKLDENGWCDVKELLDAVNSTGKRLDFAGLQEIVKTDNKQRYSFNHDMTLIRANQGHSIQVDVELEEKEPPLYLYHGTSTRFLDKIKEEGIKPMSRLYVHFSRHWMDAMNVGSRHGIPVALTVKSGEMYKAGYKFYQSENGIWLTEYVPVGYFRTRFIAGEEWGESDA